MTEFFIFLIILMIEILIIDIVNTVYYTNKLEDIMRTLKDSISEQIILSESRTKESINKIKSEDGK